MLMRKNLEELEGLKEEKHIEIRKGLKGNMPIKLRGSSSKEGYISKE